MASFVPPEEPTGGEDGRQSARRGRRNDARNMMIVSERYRPE
jgi:hypothetical protein